MLAGGRVLVGAVAVPSGLRASCTCLRASPQVWQGRGQPWRAWELGEVASGEHRGAVGSLGRPSVLIRSLRPWWWAWWARPGGGRKVHVLRIRKRSIGRDPHFVGVTSWSLIRESRTRIA